MVTITKRRSILNSLLSADDSGYSPVKGVHYFDGRDGQDASEIELRASEDYIQWRRTDESTWRNLISIEELRGEPGESGEPGPEGKIGRPGPKGEQGDTGPEGERVILQLNGTNIQWCYPTDEKWKTLFSIEDLKGDKGDTGESGEQGIEGPRGPMGLPGLKGDTGKTGPRGLQGLPGKDGKDGQQGPQGLKGDTGPQGIQGPKGDKGDKGPKGPKGDKGDKPTLGVDYFVIPGPQGRAGKDGRDGLPGEGGGADLLENTTFTYTDGLVTRIDYESGQYKTLSYNLDGTVDTLVWYRITDTVTKTFIYNLDGTVSSINITIT